MKKIYWLAPLGALLAIQLFRPDTTNPAVDPALDIKQVVQVPAEVQSLLKDACYDCHSNETQYPWYSQVAPVSWFVVNHIREGREALNFSTFGNLSAEDRAEAMEESAENIQEGEMPLESYVWMHPEAKLSDAQRTTLYQWFNANGENENEAGVSTNKKETVAESNEGAGEDDDD